MLKKIILILSLIICFLIPSVSVFAIETTQVNPEEVLEEDFPTILIDIYNTVAYKMQDGTIIYLPSIVEEDGVVWAIYKKDSSTYALTLAEEITYKVDGGVVISNGYNYKFSNNLGFNGFYTSNNLMYVSGSHGNAGSYGASSYYCIGSFYSSINLLDTDGNIARTANLVKVTEEDPDPDVPEDPDPDVPEDPDPDVPEDPDPDVPAIDTTELTEAIKENNSILNRIYKVLNNLFIMYLFFNTLPFVTTIAKRLSGKEFR